MDIAAWLRGLGLERYEEAFRDNAIDEEVLPELDEADLEKLGVLLGHRKKLLKAIAALRAGAASAGGSEESASVPTSPAEAARPTPEARKAQAERRQLTVVFVDLVGSTALANRLDPEDMREVLRAYQNALAGEVARFEGHVAKFMGDGVLAYFGWPRAHEDAAERAVRAGLAITQAVTGLRSPAGAPLAARVGIATGLVVVGDLVGNGGSQEEAVVGDTPNLAARLQTLARPGAVLIGETTRRLLGELFDLEYVPAAAIKGFAEPVAAFRVLGESAVESRFEALHPAGITPLVGREHELGLLLDRWERAREGEGQVVLLSGEPGIGKSRLVQALRERLAGEPYLPLSLFCSPFHQTSALHPVVGLLDRAAGFAREDTPAHRLDKLEALLAQATGDVARVAPLMAAVLSVPTGGRYPSVAMSPRLQKERTLEALVDQLVGLAIRQPVLAVYEDVHWADPTTLELLDLTIGRVRAFPALLIVTFRPEFAPRWAGHAHATLLTLSRLGRRQAAAIVDRLTGGRPLPEEVFEQIVARTDGVPLFVEELTKAVLESGLLREDDGRYALDGPLPPLAIPDTLHGSLLARLDRLAPVREVAQVAACVGREFSHELLAAVADRPETELAADLDRLVAAELVFRSGAGTGAAYRFKHALVHEVAYQSLLRSRRQQLHARIAQVLEERYPELVETEPELLAHHYAEAGLGERAVPYLQRAGDRAIERSAYAEAIVHLTRGLSLVEGALVGVERDRCELELRLGLGAALMATKGYAAVEVERTYTRARDLCGTVGRTPKLFPALHGLYRYYHVRGELEVARELGRRLLGLAHEAGDPACLAEAHRALGVPLLWLGEVAAARDQLEQGVAAYDAERDRAHAHLYGIDPGVVCLAYAGLAWWHLGHPDRAVARSSEAVALAERLSHPQSQALALVWAAWVRQLRREPAEVRALAEAAVALCVEQGFPLWRSMGEILGGWAQGEAGETGEGLCRLGGGLEALAATGAGLWRPSFLALLAEVLARAGRVTDGLGALEQAIGASRERGELFYAAELERLRGELLWRHGAGTVTVEARFRDALTMAQHQQSRSLQLRAASSLARLWRDHDRLAEAQDLLMPVYGWFTEGFETPDLRAAKTLLEDVASARIASPPSPRRRAAP